MNDTPTPSPSPTPTPTPSPSPAPAPAAPAPAGGDKPFYEAFTDESLRTSPTIQRYKTVEEMGRGLLNAEKRLGVPAERLLTLPDKPDDAEGYGKIYDALGRPKDAAGYKLEVAADAPAEVKDRAGRYADLAHKSGLNPAQAQALMAFSAEEGAKADAAAAAARTAANEAATGELKKAWGADFDRRLGEVGRLLTDAGGKELYDELVANDIGNNPKLMLALGKLVDERAEPGRPGDVSGASALASGTMTPAQASASLQALRADEGKVKALTDKNHPQHAAVLAERDKLLRMRDGLPPTG